MLYRRSILPSYVLKKTVGLHAWCLMGNHYHLLVETPETNLVKGMKWMQSTFANRFNRFRKSNGHVFQGRYKAILLDNDAVGPVCHYIHLNPVRAGLVDVSRLQEYKDSSFSQVWYPRQRWDYGNYHGCLEAAGGLADKPKGGACIAITLFGSRLKTPNRSGWALRRCPWDGRKEAKFLRNLLLDLGDGGPSGVGQSGVSPINHDIWLTL